MKINISDIVLSKTKSHVPTYARRDNTRTVEVSNSKHRILTKEDIYKSLERAYKHASMAR